MAILDWLLQPRRGCALRDRAAARARSIRLGVEPMEKREVLSAIATPPIYQNPFMAPNNFSEIHLNSFQTDTFSVPGPGSANKQSVQQKLLGPVPFQIAGTIAFNSQGQIVTIRVGPSVSTSGLVSAETLLLINPKTLKTIASVKLPPRTPDKGGVSFAGGGYFYLDNMDRVVCVTADQEIRIYAV
jgi:hypothetical protein